MVTLEDEANGKKVHLIIVQMGVTERTFLSLLKDVHMKKVTKLNKHPTKVDVIVRLSV